MCDRQSCAGKIAVTIPVDISKGVVLTTAQTIGAGVGITATGIHLQRTKAARSSESARRVGIGPARSGKRRNRVEAIRTRLVGIRRALGGANAGDDVAGCRARRHRIGVVERQRRIIVDVDRQRVDRQVTVDVGHLDADAEGQVFFADSRRRMIHRQVLGDRIGARLQVERDRHDDAHAGLRDLQRCRRARRVDREARRKRVGAGEGIIEITVTAGARKAARQVRRIWIGVVGATGIAARERLVVELRDCRSSELRELHPEC